MISEFGYDIVGYIISELDILYQKSDMISEVGYIISEVGYDTGSQIYYIGISIWYKTRKKLSDYIVWLFDSNGAPYL